MSRRRLASYDPLDPHSRIVDDSSRAFGPAVARKELAARLELVIVHLDRAFKNGFDFGGESGCIVRVPHGALERGRGRNVDREDAAIGQQRDGQIGGESFKKHRRRPIDHQDVGEAEKVDEPTAVDNPNVS